MEKASGMEVRMANWEKFFDLKKPPDLETKFGLCFPSPQRSENGRENYAGQERLILSFEGRYPSTTAGGSPWFRFKS